MTHAVTPTSTPDTQCCTAPPDNSATPSCHHCDHPSTAWATPIVPSFSGYVHDLVRQQCRSTIGDKFLSGSTNDARLGICKLLDNTFRELLTDDGTALRRAQENARSYTYYPQQREPLHMERTLSPDQIVTRYVLSELDEFLEQADDLIARPRLSYNHPKGWEALIDDPSWRKEMFQRVDVAGKLSRDLRQFYIDTCGFHRSASTVGVTTMNDWRMRDNDRSDLKKALHELDKLRREMANDLPRGRTTSRSSATTAAQPCRNISARSVGSDVSHTTSEVVDDARPIVSTVNGQTLERDTPGDACDGDSKTAGSSAYTQTTGFPSSASLVGSIPVSAVA